MDLDGEVGVGLLGVAQGAGVHQVFVRLVGNSYLLQPFQLPLLRQIYQIDQLFQVVTLLINREAVSFQIVVDVKDFAEGELGQVGEAQHLFEFLLVEILNLLLF